MILSEIDKHRPTSASSHAPKPNTKEKMPTLEVLVSRVDREWARRELRRAAQVQTSPERERPDTASPTTTQLPQPASHIRSHTIADITGPLSFEPPTPSMRKVLREKNIYASEAHTARLRHARKNIPKPATSWGPGNAKRRARSSHMESEQPCLSAYCAREYSWDYTSFNRTSPCRRPRVHCKYGGAWHRWWSPSGATVSPGRPLRRIVSCHPP